MDLFNAISGFKDILKPWKISIEVPFLKRLVQIIVNWQPVRNVSHLRKVFEILKTFVDNLLHSNLKPNITLTMVLPSFLLKLLPALQHNWNQLHWSTAVYERDKPVLTLVDLSLFGSSLYKLVVFSNILSYHFCLKAYFTVSYQLVESRAISS